jgi:hypothetical protein
LARRVRWGWDIGEQERLKRLLVLIDDQTVAILQYIHDYNEEQKKKNPEDRRGLTKDMVAREMYVEGVCSRLTTLRILKDLQLNGNIINKKEKEKAFSRLEINEKLNWAELRKELLISQVKKALAPFNKLIDQGELTIKIYWNRKGLPEINII